eukprot:4033634-Heterocapsa_arctica.AAC.1
MGGTLQECRQRLSLAATVNNAMQVSVSRLVEGSTVGTRRASTGGASTKMTLLANWIPHRS